MITEAGAAAEEPAGQSAAEADTKALRKEAIDLLLSTATRDLCSDLLLDSLCFYRNRQTVNE